MTNVAQPSDSDWHDWSAGWRAGHAAGELVGHAAGWRERALRPDVVPQRLAARAQALARLAGAVQAVAWRPDAHPQMAALRDLLTEAEYGDPGTHCPCCGEDGLCPDGQGAELHNLENVPEIVMGGAAWTPLS